MCTMFIIKLVNVQNRSVLTISIDIRRPQFLSILAALLPNIP